jgi:hypothetical protein
MDFQEEIEIGVCRDWGYGGGRCLGRENHGGGDVLKESEESLVVLKYTKMLSISSNVYIL